MLTWETEISVLVPQPKGGAKPRTFVVTTGGWTRGGAGQMVVRCVMQMPRGWRLVKMGVPVWVAPLWWKKPITVWGVLAGVSAGFAAMAGAAVLWPAGMGSEWVVGYIMLSVGFGFAAMADIGAKVLRGGK